MVESSFRTPLTFGTLECGSSVGSDWGSHVWMASMPQPAYRESEGLSLCVYPDLATQYLQPKDLKVTGIPTRHFLLDDMRSGPAAHWKSSVS